jgi:hypothetical protein
MLGCLKFRLASIYINLVDFQIIYIFIKTFNQI